MASSLPFFRSARPAKGQAPHRGEQARASLSPSLTGLLKKHFLLHIFLPYLFVAFLLSLYILYGSSRHIFERNALMAEHVAANVESSLGTLARELDMLTFYSQGDSLSHVASFAPSSFADIILLDASGKPVQVLRGKLNEPLASSLPHMQSLHNTAHVYERLVSRTGGEPDTLLVLSTLGETRLAATVPPAPAFCPAESPLLPSELRIWLRDSLDNMIELNCSHGTPDSRTGVPVQEDHFLDVSGNTLLFHESAFLPDGGWSVSVIQDALPAMYEESRTPVVALLISLVILLLGSLILRQSINRAVAVPLSEFAASVTEGVPGTSASFAELESLRSAFENALAILAENEARLRQSEMRVRSIFDHSVEGFFQANAHGRLLGTNSAMARMLGFENDVELLSSPSGSLEWMFADNDDLDRFFSLIELHKKVRQFEFLCRTANGPERWAQLDARGLFNDDGRLRQVEGSLTDITLRRIAEQEARRLRGLLVSTIDSLPSSIVGIDGQGRVVSLNATARRTFNISQTAAQGRRLEEVIPRLEPHMEQILHAAANPGYQPRIILHHGQDKGPAYEELTISSLVGKNLEGAVIRLDDISEQQQLEEIMLQSEKMLSVGGLAAGMAHEINNPLSAILGNAQVALKRLAPDSENNIRLARELDLGMESLRHYLEKRGATRQFKAILEAARRASHIVNDMLAFSRKADHSFASANLSTIMEQALEMLARDYSLASDHGQPDLAIHRRFDDATPPVPCSESEIRQVLFNVARNGAQAMRSMDSDRAPRDWKPTLVLSIGPGPLGARVEIEDNGPGMDDDVLRHVFEPFFTTRETGMGTGLGLSVCYFIIKEQHQGDIRIESTVGEGTRVIIDLPGPAASGNGQE